MANPRQQQPIVDYARSKESFREPPQRLGSVLKHLGPGVILLGAIVGSGELIMTTKLGAEAGFFMLWLVFVSCFGKFVVQAELTRHTISSGKTFLQVFSNLPGPRFQRPIWLSLEWLATVLLLYFIGLGVYTLLGEQRTALAETGIGAAVVIGAVISAFVIAAHSTVVWNTTGTSSRRFTPTSTRKIMDGCDRWSRKRLNDFSIAESSVMALLVFAVQTVVMSTCWPSLAKRAISVPRARPNGWRLLWNGSPKKSWNRSITASWCGRFPKFYDPRFVVTGVCWVSWLGVPGKPCGSSHRDSVPRFVPQNVISDYELKFCYWFVKPRYRIWLTAQNSHLINAMNAIGYMVPESNRCHRLTDTKKVT